MIKYKLLFIITFVAQLAFGQVEDTVTKIIHVSFDESIALRPKVKAIQPSDSAFEIHNLTFADRIVESFEYWDEIYSTYKKTIAIYPGWPNSSTTDTLLLAKREKDEHLFQGKSGKWHLLSFTIYSRDISLNHIHVGLTSKEVFELLKIKIKKKVGTGQVWIYSKDNNSKIIFVFEDDKLVAMQF